MDIGPMPTPRVDHEAIELSAQAPFQVPAPRFGEAHFTPDVPRLDAVSERRESAERISAPVNYVAERGHRAVAAAGIDRPQVTARLEAFAL